MMETVSIRDLATHDDCEVEVRGWVHGRRSGGKIVFLLIRDGTGIVQCIIEAAHAEAFEMAETLGQESSVRVRGTVRIEPRAPGGAELSVTHLVPVQCVNDYPIARKEHGVDFLMNHRHLWLRSPRQCAILRIRDTIFRSAQAFFTQCGFVRIDTPILTPGAAEGAGSLFPVDAFGNRVYLAQTGQLYLEAAAMALGRVYCCGPTFRAEKSKTRRHLAEFWMLEPEVAWATLPDLAHLAETLIVRLVTDVLEAHKDDLSVLNRDIAALSRVSAPFPRISYTDAVDLLRSPDTRSRLLDEMEADRQRLANGRARLADLEASHASAKKGWKQDALAKEIATLRDTLHELGQDLDNRPAHIDNAGSFVWGNDLGGDEETILTRLFDRPIVVSRYPKDVKAFYMKPDPDDPRVVLNLDVLAPEGYGEIIGGSVREDRLDALEKRMTDEGMPIEPYAWYLDLRRYGSVPHGGFGLGLERTVAWICGLRHIRETIPFPRMMGRMEP